MPSWKRTEEATWRSTVSHVRVWEDEAARRQDFMNRYTHVPSVLMGEAAAAMDRALRS